MNDNLEVIILAAGLGTRMKSGKIKILHHAAGRCRGLRGGALLVLLPAADELPVPPGDRGQARAVGQEHGAHGPADPQAPPGLVRDPGRRPHDGRQDDAW